MFESELVILVVVVRDSEMVMNRRDISRCGDRPAERIDSSIRVALFQQDPPKRIENDAIAGKNVSR